MAKKKETAAGTAPKKPATKKVSFEYPAPDAQAVCLAGEFNQWDVMATPLKKDKKGIWKASVSLAPGCYQYRFVVDGCWENDPACCDCIPNEFGGTNNVKTVE